MKYFFKIHNYFHYSYIHYNNNKDPIFSFADQCWAKSGSRSSQSGEGYDSTTGKYLLYHESNVTTMFFIRYVILTYLLKFAKVFA